MYIRYSLISPLIPRLDSQWIAGGGGPAKGEQVMLPECPTPDTQEEYIEVASATLEKVSSCVFCFLTFVLLPSLFLPLRLLLVLFPSLYDSDSISVPLTTYFFFLVCLSIDSGVGLILM